MTRKALTAVLCLLLAGSVIAAAAQQEARTLTRRWTETNARAWAGSQPWALGCNYIPRTAVNTLEMWQAETFDPAAIDEELGWAEDLGFNSVRVFLHYLLWDQDAGGFLKRLERFLAIADKHHIATMFVLFDDCWNAKFRLGPQPAPRPGVHNSGWVKCPGPALLEDPARWGILEAYTRGIIGFFREDRRVLAWDLYNEPGNSNYGARSLPLLESVFAGALTPPLGWNSWDSFGQAVTEDDVKANADFIAAKLAKLGWRYVVVDIEWSEPQRLGPDYPLRSKSEVDAFGRFVPAEARFPSAAGGRGFKPLSDYVHRKGLKFGVHIVRGIPRLAVERNTPIEGTPYRAAGIADKVDFCDWNEDQWGSTSRSRARRSGTTLSSASSLPGGSISSRPTTSAIGARRSPCCAGSSTGRAGPSSSACPTGRCLSTAPESS